jgi:hypothetical protein
MLSTPCHIGAMETLMILLPDQIGELVAAQARDRGVDPSTLCSGIVTEHVLGVGGAGKVGHPSLDLLAAVPPKPSGITDGSAAVFDVQKHFPRHPGLSVQLAQSFVDAALQMPGTKAFASKRGIGFEPNFVFIVYLRKRVPGGIGVSFYGGPEHHLYQGLGMGRNPNYSRALVETREELERILPDVRRSYELKFL